MRRHRLIYFDDARHYYLFVFEPPMTMRDAWRPIDEVAATGVDTFIYGVARGDGLFYPSNVGLRWGQDLDEFNAGIYWRVWNNMQSLIDRGMDPLTVLIDRAQQKGMDFFASLRMGDFPGLDATFTLNAGGRGYMHRELRDHQFAVLEELATQYAVEGVELDFAAAPGGTSFFFNDEEVQDGLPVMTDFVRRISAMVRNRPGQGAQVGARIYPTEEMNLSAGLDVRSWLQDGLLDYVNPMRYTRMMIDPNKSFDWLIDLAHNADTSVYPMIHPYYHYHWNPPNYMDLPMYATPAMMRAAAASYWARGVDGLYTWFFPWPLGDAERRLLTEIGDPDLLAESDKHYVVSRTVPYPDELPYASPLPIEINPSDAGKRFEIPLHIADEVQSSADRIRQITLKINILDLVSADQLEIRLNGQSLENETCLRDYSGGGDVVPYNGQWLEFHLERVRPSKGQNRLEIALIRRPERLVGTLKIEHVGLVVEYGSYPSRL
jgi:hypothetical protein